MNTGISSKVAAGLILAALCVTARASFTSDTWPLSQAQWNAGNGTQGQYGDWYFKKAWYDQWNNSHWWGAYHDADWNTANGCWIGYDAAWDHITRTQVQLFDLANSLIIAWQAPTSGTFNLNVLGRLLLRQLGTVASSRSDCPSSNRVATSLPWWTTSPITKPRFPTRQHPCDNGPVTVSAGDWLYFRTDPQKR